MKASKELISCIKKELASPTSNYSHSLLKKELESALNSNDFECNAVQWVRKKYGL